MTKITFDEEAVRIALTLLADAARQVSATRTPGSTICSAVATLIAGSGAHGSTEQGNMMRMAEKAGFEPYYYVDTIRVGLKA